MLSLIRQITTIFELLNLQRGEFNVEPQARRNKPNGKLYEWKEPQLKVKQVADSVDLGPLRDGLTRTHFGLELERKSRCDVSLVR